MNSVIPLLLVCLLIFKSDMMNEGKIFLDHASSVEAQPIILFLCQSNESSVVRGELISVVFSGVYSATSRV